MRSQENVLPESIKNSLISEKSLLKEMVKNGLAQITLTKDLKIISKTIVDSGRVLLILIQQIQMLFLGTILKDKYLTLTLSVNVVVKSAYLTPVNTQRLRGSQLSLLKG